MFCNTTKANWCKEHVVCGHEGFLQNLSHYQPWKSCIFAFKPVQVPKTSSFIRHCKTQNSGLCSKEEKPHDPINEPSRCNMQDGLLSVVQTGDSDLLGGRAHRTANWASFMCSILHTGYKVIGYMFAKQSYWYKLRGLLFKFKAILLVQMARAFSKLRRPRASQLSRGLFTGCTLIGRLQVTRWGRGIPPFHWKLKPKSWPPAGPGPGSPT